MCQKPYEKLFKSEKNLKNLPFKLATTSFIYPDRIIPNVKRLGTFFDEIELLIFESRPFIPKNQTVSEQAVNGQKCRSKYTILQRREIEQSVEVEVLPSSEEIKELVELSHTLELTYNVHLPIDISLTDILRSERIKAIDTVKRLLELCAPLNPTTYTLHLDFDYNKANNRLLDNDLEFDNNLKMWREITRESLETLSLSLVEPSIISIETLDYPFAYIADIVYEYGFSVCIDAGHLIRYGYNHNDNNGIKPQFDIRTLFERYRDKIPLIHLHGVDFSSFTPSVVKSDVSKFLPKDHQSLDKTPPLMLAQTMNLLKKFTGVVSLEVFNYNHLAASLTFLDNFFMDT